MKRFVFLTIFFYSCTFTYPAQSHAGAALAVVAAAGVGAAVLAAGAGQHYMQTGQYPSYVTSTANAVASAADRFYQPAYLAAGPFTLATAASFPQMVSVYLGKQTALSMSVQNVIDAAASSASSAYQDFKNWLIPFTGSPADASTETCQTFVNGKQYGPVIKNPYANRMVRLIWNQGNPFPMYLYGDLSSAGSAFGGSLRNSVSWCGYTMGYGSKGYDNGIWIIQGGKIYRYSGGEDYPNIEYPNIPGAPYYDFSQIKANYDAAPPEVKKDVQDIIKAAPAAQLSPAQAVPNSVAEAQPSPTLTPAEIQQALKDIAAEVAQQAATQAAQIAAANPTDAAAQIAAIQTAQQAAQAAQDAAEQTQEQPTEETFSPLNPSAFDEAYNPGEYDIPARFTTFLNRVKSTGLFSFSADFFNSLPGGGSPVYEIEAGQYGHHTIDLSQTLSTGLAVLKTILLACFGFLSIRAVIMKR